MAKSINDAAYDTFASAGVVGDSINDNAYKYFLAGGGSTPPGPDSVNTAAIQNNAVTAPKIASGAIDQSKIGGTARLLTLQGAAMADIGAAPTQQDFNDLLQRLRQSGVIAAGP